MTSNLRPSAGAASPGPIPGPSHLLGQRFLQRICASWILTVLILSCVPVVMADQYGDFWYTTNANTVTITNYSGSGGAVAIPGAISNSPVTSLGDRALQCRPSITSVTIPDSVTSIGTAVFDYCTGLTNVTLGNGVTNIGGSAFADCTTRLYRLRSP